MEGVFGLLSDCHNSLPNTQTGDANVQWDNSDVSINIHYGYKGISICNHFLESGQNKYLRPNIAPTHTVTKANNHGTSNGLRNDWVPVKTSNPIS